MIQSELGKSIFRLLSDLVKSDNVITVDEIDGIDKACKTFGITEREREASYDITLADAMDTLSMQRKSVREKVLRAMEDIALDDGECCRAESLLITAMELICGDIPARVFSMEFMNRPITSTQLLYIEDSRSIPGRSVLDSRDGLKEMKLIAKMGGLDLIYIPEVARHFKSYEDSGRNKLDDLKRILTLINPQADNAELETTITALKGMTSKNFYDIVLREKLEMDVTITEPSWLLRLPDSKVSGIGYANFLCFKVDNDIRSQLRRLVERLNGRQKAYSITVNEGHEKENHFLYDGFYKALLDVMSVRRMEKWELHFRLYGAGSEMYTYTANDGKEAKCVLTIRKGPEEFPIPLAGREAAYYLLVICESAANGGVNFNDTTIINAIRERYAEIYQQLSRRTEKNIPDVTVSDSRRPMKSYVRKAIIESEISRHSALQGIYLPEETADGVTKVLLDPECVYLDIFHEKDPRSTSKYMPKPVSKALKRSNLYKRLY